MVDVDCMRFPDSKRFNGIAIVAFKTKAWLDACTH